MRRRCGNSPDAQLTDEDRQAIEEVRALLAERAAQHQAEAETCGRCRRPFNPTDTRWDGHARHHDSPWCRSCVDRCHESTDAFHICAICNPDRAN